MLTKSFLFPIYRPSWRICCSVAPPQQAGCASDVVSYKFMSSITAEKNTLHTLSPPQAINRCFFGNCYPVLLPAFRLFLLSQHDKTETNLHVLFVYSAWTYVACTKSSSASCVVRALCSDLVLTGCRHLRRRHISHN